VWILTRVVFDSDLFQRGLEDEGIPDLLQMGPFTLDMSEEGFDVGLVGGNPGTSDVHGEGVKGHKFPGGARHHLGATIGDRQQHRQLL